MSAAVIPLLGRLDIDRAARRWVGAAAQDLSAVDGSRALGAGRAAPFAGLLARRHEYVLLATGLMSSVAVVPGGAGVAAVRVDRRDLLEVEPEIDGRFDLILAVDVMRRLHADEVVLPHLTWLVAPGGTLLTLDPVGQLDWAAVRRRYLADLPGVRIEEVQGHAMGACWQAPR